MFERLESIERRYAELHETMARPEVAADFEQLQELARENSSLEGVVAKYGQYKDVVASLEETQGMITQGLDEDMAQLARDEVASLQERRDRLIEEIKKALVPRDPARRSFPNVRAIRFKQGLGY